MDKLICYFEGKVHPSRNWFQRFFDWLYGRQWILVATCDNGEAVIYWHEMRRPTPNDYVCVYYGEGIEAQENV